MGSKILLIVIALGITVFLLMAIYFFLPNSNHFNQRQKSSPPADTVSTTTSTSSGETNPQGLSSHQPKITPTDNTTIEIKGPFPVDKTVSERSRQIGIMMNVWRKAIIDKNINEIKQLNMGITSFGQDGIPFLRKLATEDNNERVRAFATRVLGGMNFNEASSFFMDLLTNDKSSFVRENASWALGKSRNIKAIEPLQRVADSDESERVRQVAKESIEIIKSANKDQKGENIK